MKKTAILLAAIMVMSVSMTACNSNNDQGDYEEETTVSDVVENNDDVADTEAEGETEAEASNGNKYENDIYSLELPEGWSPMEQEGQMAFVAPAVDDFANNVIISYKQGVQATEMSEDQLKATVEQALGTEVTVNSFSEVETNIGTALRFDYTFVKDDKTITQVYMYVSADDGNTLTYAFTGLGAEAAPECDSIFNTLALK